MKSCCFRVFLFVLIFAQWTKCQTDRSLLVDNIRKKFLNLEDELWSFVLHQDKDNSVDPGIELIKKFNVFDKQLQQVPQDILYGMQTPRKSEYFLLFFSDLRIINDLYEKFRRFQAEWLTPVHKDYSEYRREITISGLVSDILHDKNNINKTVWQLHTNTTNLISDLLYIMSNQDYRCTNPSQPPQQVFYNLYNLIALTDLKGYILTHFAYLALRLQEKGNYTESSIIARDGYKQRVNETYQMFRAYMDFTSKTVYRCDPKTHIEGTTYEQLTRLIQAFIQNEVDLNPKGTCTETCSKYTLTQSHGCYDLSSDYCKYLKPCKGNIHNCKFIESHMETCQSPANSYRRYEYIEYSGGKILGQKSRCTKRTINSWFRWFVHCSYCLCYCDEQGARSDRYFNLRQSQADVNNNRVVTGMRLVKYNRIFHIQIQEGKLLPYGYIDQNTIKWVPIDGYAVTDDGYKSGKDYHTMDYNRRSLLLDDLKVPNANYLITGAKFSLNGDDLLFEIIVTPFNFTTGKLYTGDSYNIHKKWENRVRINQDRPDIPTRARSSEPDFDTNRYVDFTHTDLDKDAGQTTIPFIDIQPVNAEPAVPLQAAGIYYKGNPGYGGFVGLKVDTYDYTNNLYVDFPPKHDREDSEELLGVVIN